MDPTLSAHYLFSFFQKLRAVTLVILMWVAVYAWGAQIRDGVLVALALPFLCVTVLRVHALGYYLTRRRPRSRPGPRLAQPQPHDAFLPSYSVLVPIYKEAGVVRALIEALGRLDYPVSRLEVLFITEEHDIASRAALELVGLKPHMRIITVPDGAPRTKPRGLNYALPFARGDYVAIYDAEDAPEPGQLKMAVRAFRTRPGCIGCVQARLDIYTEPVSFVARQFTLEYMVLFYVLLPAYRRLGIPLPLGGTSNHFPRAVLEEAGGWDPFNVTEDADLGMRLARKGYRVAMIGSATWEEAPVSLGQWFGQRTRWIKGWMQTFIVHTRARWRLLRDLGLRGFLGFYLIFGGMLFSAFVHPITYVLLGYDLFTGGLHLDMAQPGLWSLCLLNLAMSYVAAAVTGAVVAIKRRRAGLVLSALLAPFYWLLISAAAYCALFELLRRPHHWSKTNHTGAGRHRIDSSGRITRKRARSPAGSRAGPART